MFIGFLSGLLANAGGILFSTFFIRRLKMPIKQALACAVILSAVLSVPGAITHWCLGHIDWNIALLLSLSWVMGLTTELFALAGHAFSGRDLVLLGGGAFLLYKASREIFDAVEQGDENARVPGKPVAAAAFWSVIAQIAVIDIVFSLDSVITAVGMVDRVGVMIAAVVASVAVMMFAARPIGEFVDRHPSIKVLALAFLAMVGMTLAAEAFGVHVPKAVIYAAIGFSLTVELLNIRARGRRQAARAAELAAPNAS